MANKLLSKSVKPTPWQVLRLRQKMGWSQLDMAKRLHLGSSTMVSRYERGERQMNMAFWELLCIKAQDERCRVKDRFEEINRRQVSVMFVNQLLEEK